MDAIKLKEKCFRNSLPRDVSNSLLQLANSIVVNNINNQMFDDRKNSSESSGDTKNSQVNKSPKIILLSSSSHKEGTTFIALHLAKTLSDMGNNSVLFLDMNFRSSFFSGSNDNEMPALKDYFSADDDFDIQKIIRETDVDNLHVAPATNKRDNLTPVLDFGKIRFLLHDSLREKYDFIIIDSAPLNPYPDSLFITPYVDAIILVIQAHKTRRQIVEKVQSVLEKQNAKILGAIINRRKHFIPRFIYKRL